MNRLEKLEDIIQNTTNFTKLELNEKDFKVYGSVLSVKPQLNTNLIDNAVKIWYNISDKKFESLVGYK